MKRILPFFSTLLLLSAPFLRAAEAPAGQVIELHACELYTGGCTASAQATLGGRTLLRVWDFEKGEAGGASLAGLQVAALQTAVSNLAVPGSVATDTVVYFPSNATAAQRDTLRGWLKSQPEFRG